MKTQVNASVFVGEHLSAAALGPCAQLTLMSPVGSVLLKASRHGLSHLTVVGEPVAGAHSSAHSSDTSASSEKVQALGEADEEALSLASGHLASARQQLLEYFAGERRVFNLALAPRGTEFQRQVWQALVNLEFGKVCSYAEIANRIHRPKAVRAVGAANGANPIAIIVPCHRVIGKDGSLTGYAHGLGMKQQLLCLESAGFSLATC
jgi:methylated-DNA-[protein]-cysteine S-methyltransferase